MGQLLKGNRTPLKNNYPLFFNNYFFKNTTKNTTKKQRSLNRKSARPEVDMIHTT